MAPRPKIAKGFREPFEKRTRKRRRKDAIELPPFEIEDGEDAYVYYVLILGIPEGVFMNADISFLKSIALDKSAYDRWLDGETERRREEVRRRNGR